MRRRNGLKFSLLCAKRQSNLDTHFIEIVIRLVLVSFCSLKMREKYTNWDYLVCTSLVSVYITQSHLCLLLQKKVCFKSIHRWIYAQEVYKLRQLSCLSLYIFLSFWGNERRPKTKYSQPLIYLIKNALNWIRGNRPTWYRECMQGLQLKGPWFCYEMQSKMFIYSIEQVHVVIS